MYLPFDLNNRLARNVWIAVGFFAAAYLVFEMSDSSVTTRILRLFVSATAADRVQSLVGFGGLALGAAGVYAGFQWLKAYTAKQRAARREAMQKAAAALKYQFADAPPPEFAAYFKAFGTLRERGLPPNASAFGSLVSNVLTQQTGSDFLAVFDFQTTINYEQQDRDSFTLFETVYLVHSERLNLPYFQTQPETAVIGGVIGDFLKSSAGLTDVNFPQNPEFSKKYLLDANKRVAVERLFTPQVLHFYEQTPLYRTIGEHRLLCLIDLRREPVDPNQIHAQISILYNLYQLLKTTSGNPPVNR